LRYAFVQDRLAAASGDFSRTSGGWANQMRVLNLQFESFKATIGQGLINALTPALQMLNRLLAKIQTVAEAFNKLTEEIFGYSDTDSGTASVASDMDAAAESTDAMGESLKKASKYLAGFDVMTKVSSSSDTDSSTSTETASGTTSSSSDTAVDSSDSTEQVSKFEQALNSIKKTAQEVGTWIKNRFATPVQQSLEKLKTPVENLKKTFENVFSDIQSLGAPLLSYFQGPFCNYIEAAMSFVSTVAAGLLDSLNTIFSDIWNVVVFPLANKFVTEWLPKLTEAQTGLINFAEQVFVNLKGAFDKVWTEAVKPAMELIVGIITSALDTIFQVWDEYGGPLVEAIQNCLDETSAALQKLWDEVLKPIWDNLIERLSQLWEQHLQPLWAKLCAAFLQISTAVANAWNWLMVCIGMICDEWGPDIVNVVNWVVDKACAGIGVVSDILGGLLDFVVDVFTGNWEGAWDKVKAVFASLKDFFKGVWISIKDVFANIPQWFESKFKSAWQKVKDVFSSGGKVFEGIKDGILGELKSIINGLIGGINNVIAVPFGGIKDALDSIRDISIMGAKPFSGLPTFDVPQIPLLANGGYVKANTPQLAMIGDNRHQGEVVSPEDKLLEMAYKAASMAGGDGSQLNRIIALLEQLISIVQDGADIVLMVDGEELARANAKGAMSLKRRYTTTEVDFA
jgi:phage-related protein